MKDNAAADLSLASYEALINAKVLVAALRKAGAEDKNPTGIAVSDIMMLSRDGCLIR